MNPQVQLNANRAISLFILATTALFFGLPLAEAKQDKIKEAIQDVADSLKKGIDKIGEDVKAVQDYLDNYPWKGIIEDKVTSGYATLYDLELNHRGQAVVVRPGERIHGRVKVSLDANQCSALSLYRIVLGFAGQEAQETIYNSLGACQDRTEKFHLIAPADPGIYQIRFRPSDLYGKNSALEEWFDENGNEPDAKTTIGFIVVK